MRRSRLGANPGKAMLAVERGILCRVGWPEVAAESTMEALLQLRRCESLRLSRTTFSPQVDGNVAVGSRRVNGRWVAGPQAPHLTKPENRWALEGGSIYSMAREQARFAQMVWARGQSEGRTFFPGRGGRNGWSGKVPRPVMGSGGDGHLGWAAKTRSRRAWPIMGPQGVTGRVSWSTVSPAFSAWRIGRWPAR